MFAQPANKRADKQDTKMQLKIERRSLSMLYTVLLDGDG
jgi:hypothetical protein